MNQRRSLSHVQTPFAQTQYLGDPAFENDLRVLFSTPSTEEDSRDHVHGFHSYPARLHPSIAKAVIAKFAPELKPQSYVLDPFCGSGTVLVEGRLAGLHVVGTDINPLAIRLSKLKSFGRSPEYRANLLESANAAAKIADDRRAQRLPPGRRLSSEDAALFAPHVLMELDSIRLGLESITNKPIREDLELVLSAILTKLSNRSGDSSKGEQPKRIAPGFATKIFLSKARELVEQLTRYQSLLPADAPRANVYLSDARDLEPIEDNSIDLIVTSPPYPGNYNYYAHHEMRLRWLNLEDRFFESHEIGARRNIGKGKRRDPITEWREQFDDVMYQLHRVIKPGAKIFMILADSVAANTAIYQDDEVAESAEACGLTLLGYASQLRPHFHQPTAQLFARRPRREHAFLLTRR